MTVMDDRMAGTGISPDAGLGVECHGVRLTYPGGASGQETLALERVDLTIPSGEFVALVGTSGCGKTSLLNMIAGLFEPTEGTISVDGKGPRSAAADVGYMFARDALLPWRSIRRNVELGLEHRAEWDRSTRRERARELLRLVGLGGFENSHPRQLSQGMRQRANLARALAPKPRLLLMDEPFAALDAHTKLRLQAEFLKILDFAGDATRSTVVFVTHDLREALLLADRVIVMLPRPGRIAADRRVDLPRERSGHLREILFSDRFNEQHRELFDMLETDL